MKRIIDEVVASSALCCVLCCQYESTENHSTVRATDFT